MPQSRARTCAVLHAGSFWWEGSSSFSSYSTPASDLQIWRQSSFSDPIPPPTPPWGPPLSTAMSLSSSPCWPWHHPEQEGFTQQLPVPGHWSCLQSASWALQNPQGALFTLRRRRWHVHLKRKFVAQIKVSWKMGVLSNSHNGTLWNGSVLDPTHPSSLGDLLLM